MKVKLLTDKHYPAALVFDDYCQDEDHCLEIECSHFDGDICVLGFCEPAPSPDWLAQNDRFVKADYDRNIAREDSNE